MAALAARNLAFAGIIPDAVWKDGRLTITAVVLCTISWIAYSLRMYTRLFILRNHGWDDAAMLLSLLAYTGMCILYFVLQDHVKRLLRMTNLSDIELLIYVDQALWVLGIAAIAFLKISLALYVLRILVSRHQRRFVQVVIIACSLFSLTVSMFTALQCIGATSRGTPYWQAFATGQCVSPKVENGLVFAHGCIAAATDLLFASIPIFVVCKSQLCRREKIIVVCILILAVVGCVAALIKIKWLWEMFMDPASLMDNWEVIGISSYVEIGMGIIAGSLSVCRSLFRKLAASQSRAISSVFSRTNPPTAARPQSNMWDGSVTTVVSVTAGQKSCLLSECMHEGRPHPRHSIQEVVPLEKDLESNLGGVVVLEVSEVSERSRSSSEDHGGLDFITSAE